MSDKLIAYINSELEVRKKKNPNFSQRAFAKQLGISHVTLSRILSKSREISFKTASVILEHLNIPDHIRNALLLTLNDPESFHHTKDSYINLTEEEILLTSNWEFRAIAACIRVSKVCHTPEGIADFLGIESKKIGIYIAILTKLRIIKLDADGKISLNVDGVLTPVLNSAATTIPQKEHIKLALEYIDRKKEGKYFYTGCTLAVPENLIPEISRRIFNFIKSESQ